jgi:hypothetical protein
MNYVIHGTFENLPLGGIRNYSSTEHPVRLFFQALHEILSPLRHEKLADFGTCSPLRPTRYRDVSNISTT